MKFKTMAILYLHKYELVTLRHLTRKEFERINKEELIIDIEPQ